MRLICTILLIYVSTLSYAQQLLYGKVMDSQTFASLQGVYVENISRNRLAETDTSGVFSIQAAIGDTLVFSSIGYHWKKYEIVDLSHQMYLIDEQIYELSKVIKHAPLDFASFTYKIMTMPMHKDSLHVSVAYEKYIPIREYTPGQIGVATIEGPITGVYNALNKHARNNIRAMELLDQKQNIYLANKKLTKELVLDVTKLPQEFFQEFIAFCKFSDEFLATASEYQIIEYLQYKRELFVQKYPHILQM